VEIAEEIYTFGCATEGRRRPGDPEPIVHTWAAPQANPEIKRPLADIRGDLAEVYQAECGAVPNASALGDAMMVLEGKARKSAPTEDDNLASLLGGLGGQTNKTSVATKLVEMAKERFALGVTVTGEAYAVPINGANVARALRGGRRSLRAELARLYFAETKTTAGTAALADALLVLEGDAQGAEPAEVALRVGRSPVDGRLVLDLGGGEDGRTVVIGPYGWEIVDHSPVLFWRTNATLPLPTPDEDGNVEELRELLNVSDADWPLVVAWLLAALIPDLPHPVLLLRGEHGTAKSSAARLLTSLIDRCACQLRTAPRNVEDWVVAAAGSWVTCLDNVSEVQPWLQDAICRAVTGDGLLRRQLYTDSDVSVLAFRRVVALTSVDPGRLQGDLADRMLTVELERIPADKRSSEEDLNVKWAKVHPRALGGLLHVAVNVLRELPAVRRTDLSRMADFGRVLLAVDAARGSNGYTTYAEQAGKTAQQVAEGDSVAIAIRENITRAWEGTASDLMARLTGDRPAKDWPATPQGMGGRLSRAAPTLRSLGWVVEQEPRTNKARRWSITPPTDTETGEEPPAESSRTSPSSLPPADQRSLGDEVGDDWGDNLADDPAADDWGDDPDDAGDDWGDDPDQCVSPGRDDGDVRDDLAGDSSRSPDIAHCTECGLPLLFPAGRTICERCRRAAAS